MKQSDKTFDTNREPRDSRARLNWYFAIKEGEVLWLPKSLSFPS